MEQPREAADRVVEARRRPALREVAAAAANAKGGRVVERPFGGGRRGLGKSLLGLSGFG